MKESVKGLKIATIVIYILALLSNITGTVLMFMDETSTYHPSEYLYGSYVSGYYETHKNTVAGIMPLCAVVLSVVALFFICFSAKKPKLIIGTLIIFIPVELLLGLSLLVVKGYLGAIGYFVCDSSMGLVFIGFVLSVIITIMTFSSSKKSSATSAPKKTIANTNKKEIDNNVRIASISRNVEIFEELRELKDLLDTGTLTESEYYLEKGKMLKRVQ